MPQEYTVREWSPWSNDDGLIRDPHGNYKGTVTFEESHNEPIDATFKTQPHPGDKKFGTVGDYTTKAGKVRKGFKGAQKPQQGSFGSGDGPSANSSDRADGMRQGMCINNAANLINAQNVTNSMTPTEWAQMVCEFAQALYDLGELKTKGGDKVSPPSTVTDTFNVTNEDIDKPINLDDIPF